MEWFRRCIEKLIYKIDINREMPSMCGMNKPGK